MGTNYVHKCKGPYKHHEENHICQLIARRDLGRVKELVKDSAYLCKNCGRTAHLAESLCNPSKI